MSTPSHPSPLWSIEPDDLLDTYKQPNALEGAVWRVGGSNAQRWPLFHPSEADPDSGYRLHPYAVEFDAPGEAARAAHVLRIDYLSIAPRIAHLALEVNGAAGLAHPRPRQSRSGEIRLQSGLHTTIYAEGELHVVLPAGLVRPGLNRLVLVARDGGEVLRVENPEKIARLDRMADGAGLIYQRLELAPLGGEPAAVAAILPSVVYRRYAGALRELCELHLELPGPIGGGELLLDVEGEPIALQVAAAAFGHIRLPFELPDGEPEAGYALSGDLGGLRLDRRGTLRRRRKWRVHVTPHVHTDIGYTHRQWEVVERLCRALDAAVGAPPPSTYHLDSAWTLEHWLQTRSPAQVARLREHVRQGRVSSSGIYVDLLTQTAALEDLVRNEQVAARLHDELGLRSDFVSVVDVASLSGSLPALLEGAGLRYLVHASNQDRGPFRVNGNLHRASPYWWEGTAGGRVLVWLAKMYCELRKVCGSPPVPSAAARGLDVWLQEYERDDYLPDVVLLYGQEADNTDLDPQPGEFVRRWNAEYAYPRLVDSDVSAFFHEVEALGERLPTIRGDGGAWWEDGAGSAAAMTALARQAQADLPAAERLDALAVLHDETRRFPEEQFEEAWRQLLLWDEHTWGAFLSVREPEALLQRDSWAVKEQLGRGATAWATRLLLAAATRHSLQWDNEGREVVVYNPHSWTVSGPVDVEFEPDETVGVPTRVRRRLATQQTVELWIDELPGLSYRRLPLRRGEPAPLPVRASGTAIESEHYRLEVDPARGCVASLVDRALGRELVDPHAPWAFGALVRARGGEGTRLVSNQADLPEGDPQLDDSFDLRDVHVLRHELGASLVLAGTFDGGPLEIEWTLPAGAHRVDVAYTWQKPERTEKEAAYVAFPLALPDAAVHSDSQLGWVDWNADRLPGACQDWLPLQTSVLLRGEGCEVQICSPDVPLFCVGDAVRGRWSKERDLSGGRILSYVLNNYWHTNYRGSQGGELRVRYSLASGASSDFARAHRAGWEARRPLYAQRLSLQDFRAPRAPYAAPTGGTLAELDSEGVVLSTLTGSGDGFVARFQETAGRPGRATLRIPGRRIVSASATDLLGRELAPAPVAGGALTVDVEPWGLASVRFEIG